MSTTLVENELSLSMVPRVGLHVRDLSIIASNTNTVLVDSFSLDLPSGSVMAVMGGSGSGKTTLLNVLASKISGGLKTEGTINYVLEGEVTENQHVKMAYLPQQDVLSARLTCRETLKYAADLKLDKTEEEKAIIVDQLIRELGLKDCADTEVGDSTHKGLSGGEQRRLSAGTQMISNPSIMFLDEPTTGLDAYSAYLVVKTLKKLAIEDGRTFIMSIHQPRSDILFLLDNVCILSKGKVVYCDAMKNTIPYFSSLGYDVPPMVNPADYFIDISSVDGRSDEAEEETRIRLNQLVESWKQYEANTLCYEPVDTSKEIQVENMSNRLSYWKQVRVLTRRNFQLNRSDYVTLIATFGEPAVMGTLVGWIYYKPDKTTVGGLRTTAGCLYASVVVQCYLYLLFDTYRLCEQDIALYDRERAEGSVTPLAFMTARKLSLFLSDDILMILIFTTITYFMFGLEADGAKFFYQFSITFLSQMCCAGLAMVSVAVSRDFSKASLVGNLTFTVLSMSCGFFVNAKVMPVYVRWTKYIGFTWYGFGALLSSTFTDTSCPTDDLASCYGNQLLDSYGFPRNWITVPAIVIFCWCIGYYFVAFVILYLHKVDITLQSEVKSKKKKLDEKENKEIMIDPFASISKENSEKEIDIESRSTSNSEITITLQDIDLQVRYKRFFKNIRGGLSHEEVKEILQSVNAVFKPGMINAIMGPSGSGKSTLLNLISGRIKQSVFSKFNTSGKIMFNDVQISEDMFKGVCSYVSQDDNHLLAKLTVRETFKFAADLRLHHLTSEQRAIKTDELIRALGLKHCENNIIGNEFIKGISGGEKRRVSMGIQLLNDPPILLLDEPTSGLDSFTSATILEILKKLATEYSKTVIITIHQPRSELFKEFGNVLLLAKSGRTAFNGSPDKMIEYFSSLGYDCPEFTNVADFFLDLISINTQNEQNEYTSKARAEHILTSWKQRNNTLSVKSPVSEKNEMSEENFLLEYGHCVRKPCTPLLAYLVNVKRQSITTRRNFDSLMARIAQIPGLGAIFALFFAPLKHNYNSINNRLGLAQESTALYFVGMLANLACYPAERDYFYKEHEDNVYGIGPFFLAYMTLELPLSLLASIIYAIFTVLACGLPRTAGNFFANVYCSFIVSGCGEALGIMTNTFFERPGFVVNCISVLLSIGTQMSGLMSLHMPKVLKGFNYLNPVGYTSLIIINFAFPDSMKLTCEDGGRNPDGTCELPNGRAVLESYGLVANTREYLGIVICVAIIYRLIAYCILKAKLEWLKW
ncbi:uncharacterized protein NDAI_0B02870 [Naumovozyma dairenensis CBS 421]|uniref:ABC transporter domain-containing protein n=1 Tax=Naumovozyma dairenensis (strain ATCC 10597 / BCRC 20456 / CBS 421 / NBRC 0211 / NRRL Y-12639) TaxID=1071378 RepID=G0W6B1_NAUDC|nr:hypothetical protein NDAI_0B02870 [Naumovozyma dairenensis CBS 421]CCD23322.1 hypothetical protein NDAI_0B02870 [Naumovozyma dairenensis CBS 421]